MCVFDQADDARQDRFGTQGQGAYDQAAFAIDRTTGDLVTRLFRYRQAFAADQCLVSMALSFDDFTIHRKAFAGFDHDQVVQAQFADRHITFLAIDQQQGTLRAQGFEGADGAGGLAFGAAFQVFAEQHQGDHHGRGFEVQMRHHPGAGLGPFIDTQAVTGAGPDGDQQVHVASTSAHGFPGGDIETCAENELHRGGEDELRPGRQHPVHTERLQHHRQYQGQRQQYRQGHRPALLAQAAFGIGLIDLGALRQAGRVAGMDDGVDQAAAVELAEHLDVRTFVGQVDTDLLYAGYFGQCPFDPAGAGGAGHAADLQLQALVGHMVAGLFDRLDQGRQAIGRCLNACLFGGEVDADLFGAADFTQGTLDPASTAGAGHADNRQIESGRCRHGHSSLDRPPASTLPCG
ncbi:hypothetical protein D3C80_1097830 [compost metagenome]